MRRVRFPARHLRLVAAVMPARQERYSGKGHVVVRLVAILTLIVPVASAAPLGSTWPSQAVTQRPIASTAPLGSTWPSQARPIASAAPPESTCPSQAATQRPIASAAPLGSTWPSQARPIASAAPPESTWPSQAATKRLIALIVCGQLKAQVYVGQCIVGVTSVTREGLQNIVLGLATILRITQPKMMH
jgi:hypothetical protein